MHALRHTLAVMALPAALMGGASALCAAADTPPAPATPPATAATDAVSASLPPAEDTAKSALDRSPRHGEFVDVPLPGSKTALRAWVVYPERADKAGVVVVIHEIYGLTDWIRGVADRLAAEGFIAVAPDLLSGMGPQGGGTESVASRDDVVKLIRALTPQETAARVDAVRAWTTKLPAATDKVVTLGFCWGGERSFEYAAAAHPPAGAVVFYGTSPDSATLAQVKAPVLGLYGGDDARVTSTVAPAKQALDKLGRSFDPHVFDGAGHGFLRAQGDRDGANLRATQQAWPLVIAFLRKQLS